MVIEKLTPESKKMLNFSNACLVTNQESLFENLREYWQTDKLNMKHRLADLVGEHECGLYIIDTNVSDMNIWPAPLLAEPDAYSKLWLFLVSRLSDTFKLQNLPTNARFFDRDHFEIGDLMSFIKTQSDPELGKIIAEVNYFENIKSFFIRMENGKMYNLRLSDLPEGDSSGVIKWSIGEEHKYIQVIQQSGNRFEIPWDDILYHCEPEYEYYRGKLDQNADKSLKLIGERVRELREAKGLSISDLAIKAGMKRPNLSRLEHGRHQPSLETLERIAESLGISVAQLITKRFAKPTTGNSGGR